MLYFCVFLYFQTIFDFISSYLSKIFVVCHWCVCYLTILIDIYCPIKICDNLSTYSLNCTVFLKLCNFLFDKNLFSRFTHNRFHTSPVLSLHINFIPKVCKRLYIYFKEDKLFNWSLFNTIILLNMSLR